MNLIQSVLKFAKFFIPSFAVILLFLVPVKNVYANENFTTSYRVTYDVKEDQNTKVLLNIGLTNKTTDFFASSYEVQTGYNDIKNIYIADSSGPLTFKTENTDNGVKISFNFKDKTVGKGNTQNFLISFDTNEISKNFGTVKEINIPALANQQEYTSFNVEVKIPESFGNPSIVKPNNGSVKDDGSIVFTKNDLGNGGISIAYGDFQTYQFNLNYHIRNKNVFPELTEIVIPSDNSYQKVAIDRMDPKPENVIIDEDGNWLARYKLLPSQGLNVTVSGRSKVYHRPKSEELSQQQKNLYLKPKKYWESNDTQIQELADELKTPRAIYDYVVKTLEYDTNRISQAQVRAGAKNVLEKPDSAVCLEFTDLFVALARAAGIPARAVEGYANTSNSAYRPLSLVEDVLHAWPQYWDEEKKAWVMVDPTWGNTTKGIDYFDVLDFDHFAFAIKGAESDYPVPAGGYKSSSPKEQKDVHVKTLESFEESKPSLNVTTDFKKNLYGGLPLTGYLVVTNDSKLITPAQTFIVSADGLNPKTQELYIERIPPYGKKIVPIKFSAVPPLTNTTYVAKISLKQDTLTKEIIILPIYRSIYFAYFLGGILAGILLLTISFIIYRSRRIHFPK